MATLLLATAGSSIGSAVAANSTMGAELLGAVGQAAGSIIGRVVDQNIMGFGSAAVEGGRLERLRMQTSMEGSHIPQVWGSTRVSGKLIWTSRFFEHRSRSQQGGSGKGGGSSQTVYSYDISFAILLCEGEIVTVSRIWADGKEISLAEHNIRIHKGSYNQNPDPLIEAIEGDENTPAYRGYAYIVFENLALDTFGNRIPNISAEVVRRPLSVANEDGEALLENLIQAVSLIPGSGEFSLATTKVRREEREGVFRYENVNNNKGISDSLQSIGHLEEELTHCKSASLVVSWFGDTLACGECLLRPGVDNSDKRTHPLSFNVSGIDRKNAYQISRNQHGRANSGGTPSDNSVIEFIRDLKERNINILFYPFIMMDIPEDNKLLDPVSGDIGQPAFPWRGRITPVISAMRTQEVTDEISRFFGEADISDFTVTESSVEYTGVEDWGYRRFILHYAHLCKIAGGVHAFSIGSEMKSLTQSYSAIGVYPAVEELRRLARDVRSILGEDVNIGYSADWSEYACHVPQGDSSSLFYNLDPLWSDDNIDFIGIDNYMPLADWRDNDTHIDLRNGYNSIYDMKYLQHNIEGGEGYDWYYSSIEDRREQNRTPIVDIAYGKDWVYRYKDMRSWWGNEHLNRIDGIEEDVSTPWLPQSKPIWFTEVGCPAVDKGANQPNIFNAPGSSESGLPYFSSGARDDYMQLQMLRALLSYWGTDANNPVSDVYNAPMVDCNNCYIWAWDVRPWPDFPARTDIWSDGGNYYTGHWLQGRGRSVSLARVVTEICRKAGLADEEFDTSALHGVVKGFVSDRNMSARALLQSLMMVYAFDVYESGGRVCFSHRGNNQVTFVDHDAMILPDGKDASYPVSFTTSEKSILPSVIRLSYIREGDDHTIGVVEARTAITNDEHVENIEVPIVMSVSEAQNIADRWLVEAYESAHHASFALGIQNIDLEPLDIVALSQDGKNYNYRIDSITDGFVRQIKAVRTSLSIYNMSARETASISKFRKTVYAPPVVEIMDIPAINSTNINFPLVAAFADPWPGTLSVYYTSDSSGYEFLCDVSSPATIGRTESALFAGSPHLVSRGDSLLVSLSGNNLYSYEWGHVLSGKNTAALKVGDNSWEIFQFQKAELVGSYLYELSGLIRGQFGTEMNMVDVLDAGARFVLLDSAITSFNTRDNIWGRSIKYRIGPSSLSYDREEYTEIEHIFEAVNLRPLPPAHLRVSKSGVEGNVLVSWVRRERANYDNWNGVGPSFLDLPETYQLRIKWSNGLEKIINTSDTQYLLTHTISIQHDSSNPFPVEFAVARVSHVYGPGEYRRINTNE